ncbi:hypothetical protein IEQ34_016742 [Dendrobium chrysotoxum]|uniref:Uncharacterized protein n=1 Tax=Dendrobium chrysotoxum TaxID=161865 RepID=A0AAV7GHC7_DENCH|nr:hypothetical protein IEQ34_016742 [Dendrobium chrysotoxum]
MPPIEPIFREAISSGYEQRGADFARRWADHERRGADFERRRGDFEEGFGYERRRKDYDTWGRPHPRGMGAYGAIRGN